MTERVGCISYDIGRTGVRAPNFDLFLHPPDATLIRLDTGQVDK